MLPDRRGSNPKPRSFFSSEPRLVAYDNTMDATLGNRRRAKRRMSERTTITTTLTSNPALGRDRGEGLCASWGTIAPETPGQERRSGVPTQQALEYGRRAAINQMGFVS